MKSTAHNLADRTLDFALKIIEIGQKLEERPVTARTLARQLVRSGTSIGANVAEGDGAQSEADFLTKLSIAQKEARETQYWLRLIARSGLLPERQLADIIDECSQLVAILTASCRTMKSKRTQ